MGKKKKSCKNTSKPKSKKSFFQFVWMVIWDKENTGDQFTKGIFSALLSTALVFAALLLALYSISSPVIIGASLDWTVQELWFSNMQKMMTVVLRMISGCVFAFTLKGCANEIRRAEDTTQIVNIFSAVVSLAALVVALVALIRG